MRDEGVVVMQEGLLHRMTFFITAVAFEELFPSVATDA
jgi:hypothetical protein